MNDFKTQLDWSLNKEQIKHDIPIVIAARPAGFKPKRIMKTDDKTDKKGADYVLIDKSDNKIFFDTKRRLKGCSKFWRNRIPEIAIEIFSDVKNKTHGWLGKDSVADYVIFIFDLADSHYAYVAPFKNLRETTKKHFHDWIKRFGVKYQSNYNNGNYYKSSALFLPVTELEKTVDGFFSIYQFN